MMNLTNLSKKQWMTIGFVIIGLIVLYLVLKHAFKRDPKKVRVQVNLTDEEGHSMGSYDPSTMVATLEQVLTTTYWWDASERCEAIRQLLKLSAPQFMAVVYGYKKHTGQTLMDAMSKCWKVCKDDYDAPLNDYELVEQRFHILKSTYKEQASIRA